MSKMGRISGAISRVTSVLRSDRFAIAAAIVSLSAAAYFSGIATAYLKVFPYNFVRDAIEGTRAYLSLDKDNMPMNFDGWAQEPAKPVITDDAGEEAILISGGPFRRLDLCPQHGCLGWVIDRRGEVLYKWETDFSALIEGGSGHAGRFNLKNLNLIALNLQADGSLIASFQSRNTFPYQVGLAKFDREGKLVWKRLDLEHHWFAVSESGVIYAPFAKVRKNTPALPGTKIALHCRTAAIYDEGVREISPDGAMVSETSFMEMLPKENYQGLFYGAGDGCDPLHVNSIDVASAQFAEQAAGVDEGDLLVSLREMSALLVLDRDDRSVKRVIVGRTAAQHSARFLSNGDIVVFDNLGGEESRGGSRIVRINLNSDELTVIYPRLGDAHFYSAFVGHIDPSWDDRRLLVAVTGQGRILEIDAQSGDELWSMEIREPTDSYLSAIGRKPDAPFARFAINGAYYVDSRIFAPNAD